MSGPYQPLPEILPPAPQAGSLLQSAGTLAGEWRSGVAMAQHAWDNFEWPDCPPDWEAAWTEEVGTTVLADKNLHSTAAFPACEAWRFDPFTVYTPVSEVEVAPELARRLTDAVQKVHDALFSRAVARALYNPELDAGAVAYLPPFAQTADTNPTLGYGTNLGATVGMLDPTAAYAALLAAYAERAGTTGGAMMHCSPGLLPYFITNALVAQTGQRFMGPGGTIVVADAGYPTGAVPRDVVNDSFGSPALLAPESWMFVTGPVEVAYDTARVIEGGLVADARWNRWALLIEQRAIYRFDPAMTVGVPVCTPHVNCQNYSSSV